MVISEIIEKRKIDFKGKIIKYTKVHCQLKELIQK